MSDLYGSGRLITDLEPVGKGTDDWYTPPRIFELLDVVFDVDVAAPEGGVPWIPAKRYYTELDDGLVQPWEGFVWCNPPYSAPARWLDRMREHGDGILLIRSDLSSGAYYRAFTDADFLHVPHGRLQFVNGHGIEGKGGGPTFSTVFLGFGERAKCLARLDGTTRRLVEVTDGG